MSAGQGQALFGKHDYANGRHGRTDGRHGYAGGIQGASRSGRRISSGALGQLTSRPADEVWAWHDPEEDIFTHDFLKRAGERTYAAGKALVLLDIEADCYPLAYLPVARVAELTELAADAGYRVEVFDGRS
jgi:hypothetical protein